MPESLWRQAATRWLFAVSVLGFGGLFLTLAALPVEATRHGASAGISGVVTSVLFITTVLTQVFVGRLVRRFGLAPTLIAGLVLLGAPAPGYLIDYGLPWWLVVSVIRGVGFGVIAVIGSLLAVRIVPAHQLGRSIGLYGLAISVASLICIPIGVALTTSGHFTVVALLAVMPLLAIGAIAPIIRRQVDPPSSRSDARAPAGRVIRQVLGPSTILFVLTFTGGGLVSYLPIDRPSGSDAALALFIFSATGALCRFGAGTFADRFGAHRVVPIGIVIAVGGAVALGATVGAAGAVPLFLAAGLFGLGFGTVQNLTLVMAFGRAGAAGAATASAFWNGAFDLGTSIGAFAIGAVAAAGLGLGWTLAGCATLIALSVLLINPGRRETRPPVSPEPGPATRP